MQTQDKTKTEKQGKEKESVKTVNNWPTGLTISKDEEISVSIAEDMAVVLTEKAFEQLFGWAYCTEREISCLGSVKRESNTFYIQEFYLIKQSGCYVNTELDQQAVSELIERLLGEGNIQRAKSIKCWAHSHPNMDTFWSDVDDQTCRLLVSDYLVSLVVGRNFAIRCRIDVASPIPVAFDNVPVVYQMPEEKIPLDKYSRQVKESVADKSLNLPAKTNRETLLDDEFIPEIYCGYCGNWHQEGECPLTDLQNWPQIPEDEDIPF